MGTRIDLYAVDVPAFAAHIDQAIAKSLWAYAENSSDHAISIDWNGPTSNRRYRAVPGESIACLDKSHWVHVSKDGMAEVAFLQTTVRDYLGREPSYALLSLPGQAAMPACHK